MFAKCNIALAEKFVAFDKSHVALAEKFIAVAKCNVALAEKFVAFANCNIALVGEFRCVRQLQCRAGGEARCIRRAQCRAGGNDAQISARKAGGTRSRYSRETKQQEPPYLAQPFLEATDCTQCVILPAKRRSMYGSGGAARWLRR